MIPWPRSPAVAGCAGATQRRLRPMPAATASAGEQELGVSGSPVTSAADEHAEDRLGEGEGGERARPVALEQPRVHDEVEPGDQRALVGERAGQGRRPAGGRRLRRSARSDEEAARSRSAAWETSSFTGSSRWTARARYTMPLGEQERAATNTTSVAEQRSPRRARASRAKSSTMPRVGDERRRPAWRAVRRSPGIRKWARTHRVHRVRVEQRPRRGRRW